MPRPRVGRGSDEPAYAGCADSAGYDLIAYGR